MPSEDRRSGGFFALGTKVRCKAILPAGKKGEKGEEACRAPGFASHASPTLAALRLAHEHTRAQHARHARCTHASLASDVHMHTHSNMHLHTHKSIMWFLVSLATG